MKKRYEILFPSALDLNRNYNQESNIGIIFGIIFAKES